MSGWIFFNCHILKGLSILMHVCVKNYNKKIVLLSCINIFYDLWIKVGWVKITSFGQFDLWIKVGWVKIEICQSGFVALQVRDVDPGPFVVKICVINKRIMVLPSVLLLSHVINHIKSFFFLNFCRSYLSF